MDSSIHVRSRTVILHVQEVSQRDAVEVEGLVRTEPSVHRGCAPWPSALCFYAPPLCGAKVLTSRTSLGQLRRGRGLSR